jgi:hypothetical protein
MPDMFSFNDAVRAAANKYLNASGGTVVGGYTAGTAVTRATAPTLIVGGVSGANTVQALNVDSNGYITALGAHTTASTPNATNGFMVGGSDGTVYRHFTVNTNGHLYTAGVQGNGSAHTTNVVLVAGSDGTNARALKTDAGGNVATSGSLTTGVSGTGAGGTMVGGTDGTNYRHISVTNGGALIINGVTTAGAAANPVNIQVGGSDGANNRTLRTDTNGQLLINGVQTNNSAHGATAIMVSGSDGTNARPMRTDTSGNVAIYETRRTVFQNETTTNLGISATFTGTARDAGVAANASYWATYFNAFFLANQAGTAYIEGSNDNTTWYTIATAAIAVSVPLTLQVPVMTRYHRVKVVNGAVAQTSFFVNSSYTAS